MTLSFTTKINGQPNYFPEKIIAGLDLYDHRKMTLNDGLAEVLEPTDTEFYSGACNPLFDHKPKLHTIRLDPKNRWKAGMDIHMVIKNRTPDRFQFAPVVKCNSTQILGVHYPKNGIGKPEVQVDNMLHKYDSSLVKQLAINDGFDSIEDFFAYFNKDFTGKLIHWTALKY
jgi:hypothetical protein